MKAAFTIYLRAKILVHLWGIKLRGNGGASCKLRISNRSFIELQFFCVENIFENKSMDQKKI